MSFFNSPTQKKRDANADVKSLAMRLRKVGSDALVRHEMNEALTNAMRRVCAYGIHSAVDFRRFDRAALPAWEFEGVRAAYDVVSRDMGGDDWYIEDCPALAHTSGDSFAGRAGDRAVEHIAGRMGEELRVSNDASSSVKRRLL